MFAFPYLAQKNLCDFGLLSKYHEPQQYDKLDFITIKTIFSLKDTAKKMEDKHRLEENIYKHLRKRWTQMNI